MKSNRKSKPNDVLKYSGMAFEMVAYLGVGLILGRFLDKWIDNKHPYFTLILGIIFLSAYFVRLVKDLSKK